MANNLPPQVSEEEDKKQQKPRAFMPFLWYKKAFFGLRGSLEEKDNGTKRIDGA
jgi:hypothetical protein